MYPETMFLPLRPIYPNILMNAHGLHWVCIVCDKEHEEEIQVGIFKPVKTNGGDIKTMLTTILYTPK